MCLCSSHVLPKISRKPIRVQKVLLVGDKRILTPIKYHEVKFVDGVCVIRSRVPWWKVLLRRLNWIKDGDVRAVIRDEGVHSYNVGVKYKGELYGAYEAEIPAWTPYWVSVGGYEYASAKLVVYDKKFKEEEV